MKKNFVLLDIDYVTYEEKPLIRLFGKEIDTKKSVIALDDSFIPYFYIVPSDIELCISDLGELEKEEEIKIKEMEVITLKDFQVPKKFIKISFKHPQEVPKYRDIIRDLDSVMQIREHDIPFYRRYLIDKEEKRIYDTIDQSRNQTFLLSKPWTEPLKKKRKLSI